jgi:lysine-specific demethylase/histidyl-hydroxylase NO66
MLDYSEVRFGALQGLLGSAVDLEAFFERYWEQCPLLVKDARWPKDILTSEGIEDLISFRRHGTDVVLARTAFDSVAERATYSSRHSTDADDIDQAWRDGSTVIITAIHKRASHVALFIQELERAFQHAVGANLYFTPASNQGFKTHVDEHDVFVLQLDGEKAWTVFDMDEGSRRTPARDAAVFPMQLVLRQGQALYIPKGYPHCAAATLGSASTHLTVGLYPFQLNDLISRSLCEVARAHPQLRLSISPLSDSLAQQIPPPLLEKVFDEKYLASARRAMTKDFLQRAKPFIRGRFSQGPSAIGLGSKVHSRFYGMTLVEVKDGHASIYFPGNYVSGPVVLEAALQFVSEQERFYPRELPGGLSDRTKVVLAQRLAREGLLTLDEEEACKGCKITDG